MSDFRNAIAGRKLRPWMLGGMALAAALTIAAPGRADTAEDLNYAELNRITTAPAQPAMPSAPQPATPTVLRGASPSPQGNAYQADVDCNNPYYAQYCQAYAAWLGQYYASGSYGYAYPYDDWDYGFGYPGFVIGFGDFRGHRFHNFHNFAFAHGMGFHGGFHGGGFHGGGFHGGGFHGGGGGGHR
jgi:uncharacterized membrane protein YgcG